MNPSALSSGAQKVNAIAGMEFELIVPNFSNVSDIDTYDNDVEITGGFRQINSFFMRNSVNRPMQLAQLMAKLKKEYNSWRIPQIRNMLIDLLISNILDSPDNTTPQNEVEQQVSIEVNSLDDNELIAKGNSYNILNDSDGYDPVAEFLDHMNLISMADIAIQYHTYINWPYIKDTFNIKDLMKQFTDVIGKQIVYNEKYHGGARLPNAYTLEPDSSIRPDAKDGGLEFISPPMPLSDMLSDLAKMVNWANSVGMYTNTSCGLHMNVSVPNFDNDKLDYVKLALLLGDEFVLDQFSRLGNTFAHSSFSEVINKIDNLSDTKLDAVLSHIKNGLTDLASKVIMVRNADKYVSINVHDGYVEFRSPGGDWLNEDIGKLSNTLNRFVVALDAACDPMKHRKEYLIKLYKLLPPKSYDRDPITTFARYVAGDLSKSDLKGILRSFRSNSKA